MLITLQEYAKERYLAEFHRVGSRPPMDEDSEITAVALQLIDYAFRMSAEQPKLGVGVNASYDIEVDGVKSTLRNPVTGGTYAIYAAFLYNVLTSVLCAAVYVHQYLCSNLPPTLQTHVM
ncbi:hypothetical protein PHMEG_0005011 [Phytophthora megakarya]|uniref:Uncharacterized protein n=1 Tax=Phytophthora megakarya TaxID=4795 RepID=A0A225WTY0_9STRA|nr:hypothetical protein PHMEG_0005011 [Phytophthora megakarya]